MNPVQRSTNTKRLNEFIQKTTRKASPNFIQSFQMGASCQPSPQPPGTGPAPQALGRARAVRQLQLGRRGHQFLRLQHQPATAVDIPSYYLNDPKCIWQRVDLLIKINEFDSFISIIIYYIYIIYKYIIYNNIYIYVTYLPIHPSTGTLVGWPPAATGATARPPRPSRPSAAPTAPWAPGCARPGRTHLEGSELGTCLGP